MGRTEKGQTLFEQLQAAQEAGRTLTPQGRQMLQDLQAAGEPSGITTPSLTRPFVLSEEQRQAARGGFKRFGAGLLEGLAGTADIAAEALKGFAQPGGIGPSFAPLNPPEAEPFESFPATRALGETGIVPPGEPTGLQTVGQFLGGSAVPAAVGLGAVRGVAALPSIARIAAADVLGAGGQVAARAAGLGLGGQLAGAALAGAGPDVAARAIAGSVGKAAARKGLRATFANLTTDAELAQAAKLARNIREVPGFENLPLSVTGLTGGATDPLDRFLAASESRRAGIAARQVSAEQALERTYRIAFEAGASPDQVTAAQAAVGGEIVRRAIDLDTLPPLNEFGDVDRRALNTAMNNIQVAADAQLQANRSIVNAAYDALDLDQAVDISPLVESSLTFLSQNVTEAGNPANIPRALRQLLKIKAVQNGVGANQAIAKALDDLPEALRPSIVEQLGVQGGTPIVVSLRELQANAQFAVDDLVALTSTPGASANQRRLQLEYFDSVVDVVETAAPEAREAAALHRQLVAPYRDQRSFLGKALHRRFASDADFALEPVDLPSLLIKADGQPRSVDDLKQLSSLLGQDEAEKVVRTAVFSDLFRSATDTSSGSPRVISKNYQEWIRTHQDILEAYPSISKEVRNLGTATKRLETIGLQLTARPILDDLGDSTVRLFFSDTPGGIASQIINSPTPAESARRVRDVIGHSPQAKKVIGQALYDDFLETVGRPGGGAAGDKAVRFSSGMYRRYLAQNGAVLRELYGPSGFKRFQELLPAVDAIETLLGIRPGGNISPSFQRAEQQTFARTGQLRRGLILGPTFAASEETILAGGRLFRNMRTEEVLTILNDAMFDPAFALDVKRGLDTKSVARSIEIRQRLLAHITHTARIRHETADGRTTPDPLQASQRELIFGPALAAGLQGP